MKLLRLSIIFYISLLFLFVAGCRESSAPEIVISPEEIIQNTAVQMNGLAGFHFFIERDGAPAYVDPPDNLFVFRRAEGDFTAPERAQAIVRIIGPGLITDVQVVTIAEVQWQTNPLTGEWEVLPPNWGFDPTVLFDAEVGLQSILQNDMSDVKLEGVEQLDGEGNGRFQKISANIDGQRLFTMSNGLIGPTQVQAELWIDTDTFNLHRVVIVEPEEEEPSVWEVKFSQFNQAIPISSPIEE
ncbi:MAG: LppX_LprAFG lipoprotein [Chloroflexota bacterium]